MDNNCIHSGSLEPDICTKQMITEGPLPPAGKCACPATVFFLWGGLCVMVTECWAIVIVILAMCYIFLRARKPEYSIGILPLILVPLSHLLGTGILYWFGDHITLDHSLVGIGIDVTGLVITCVLLGFAVQAIKSRKQRNALLVCCTGFTLILAWVLLLNVGK